MIQRIQSLFLGLIAILMTVFLFVNIWDKSIVDTGEHVSLNAFKMIYTQQGSVKQEITTIYLAILAAISIISACTALFSYRNRMRQLFIGLINSLAIAATLGLIVYFSFQGEKWLISTAKGSYGPGLIIPSICLICNTLANKFIRRDEAMVKSADRMR